MGPCCAFSMHIALCTHTHIYDHLDNYCTWLWPNDDARTKTRRILFRDRNAMLMDIKRLHIELFPLNIDTYAPNEYQLPVTEFEQRRWAEGEERERERRTHTQDMTKNVHYLPSPLAFNAICYIIREISFFLLLLLLVSSSLPLFSPSLFLFLSILFVLIFAHYILCRVDKYTTHRVRSFITFLTWIITATTLNKCI